MARYGGNYSYSPRRRRRRGDNTGVLRAFTIILPLLIIAVVGVGIFFAYRNYAKNNPQTEYPKSQASEQLYSEEEAALLVSVIDSDSPLSADYVPQLVSEGGVYVNSLVVDELAKMVTAAQADGCSLKISAGYVSYEEQELLNRTEQERLQSELDYTAVRAEAEAKKTVPAAGCSESQTGLLLEFISESTEDFSKSDEYRWLLRHANEYGFVLRYSQTQENYNPRLFRFVGVENAMNMRSFGMSLDEYSAYLAQKQENGSKKQAD